MWSIIPETITPPPMIHPNNRKKRLISSIEDILGDSVIEDSKKRQIVETHDKIFDEYENHLHFYRTKLMQTEQNLQSTHRYVQRLSEQIHQKSNLLRNKNNDLSRHLTMINALRSEIDGYQIRVLEAETQNEDNIIHYKRILATLSKEKKDDGRAKDYISHIKQALKAYDNEEDIESLTKNESKCVICLQNQAKIICYPCCHLEFCCECAGLYIGKDESFFKNSNNISFTDSEKFQCTRCKLDIDKLHYIFN